MTPEDECIQMHLWAEYRFSPTKSRFVSGQLLGCLRSKDIRLFNSLLGQLWKSGVDVNRVLLLETQETCLDIACKEGLLEFVQALLQKGANVNRINEGQYSAAIHFATEKDHEDVLRELLEDPRININLQAGSRTALHIAVSNRNLRCATLLLEKGADPNVPNSKGLTPLHVAAMKKQRPMIDLILTKSKLAPDLDSYKDYNGETTRDVLMKKVPELLLPPAIDRHPDINLLKYHLSANDESRFLDCLKVMQDNQIVDVKTLIEMAVERNFMSAVSRLLKKLTVSCNLEKAANIAVQNSLPNILSLIMQNFPNADRNALNKLLLNACIELGIPSRGSKEKVGNRLECLRLILNKTEVDVQCTDGKGNTPLHYAARADSHEAVLMLLERGSYLGHINNYGSSAVVDVSPSTLSEYFDSCIQAQKEVTNVCNIEFDYRCLIPPNDDQRSREMNVFQCIAGNSGLKHLLKHPLLSSFIYLKWQTISWILHVIFTFHLLLYILLSVYIIGATSNDNSNKTEATSSESTVVAITKLSSAILLSVFALWKLIQLILSPCCYLSNIKNWFEMGVAVLGFFMLYGVVPNSIAAVVILSFAWLLVVQMGHYSTLSMDIEMFITVFRKFLRFLTVYAILIFSFAVAFFVLFKGKENFLDLSGSMFKTIIMLTGEFDADSIPFDANPLMSHLVFVVFVFMIAIVLFNLLNGLAVSDTAEIIGKAELVCLTSRVKMICDIENLVISRPRYHAPGCLLSKYDLCFWQITPISFLASQVLMQPNLKQNKFGVELYDRSKMDSGIVKRAREIVSTKERESDNERILGELEMIREQLTLLDAKLNSSQGFDNNNVNVRGDS